MSLEGLTTYDVTERHARRLRRQCHAALQSASAAKRPAAAPRGLLFRRVIAPALGGAWCLAYLAEILWRAAAMYLLPR